MLSGQLGVTENRFGFGRSVTFVKVLDWHTGQLFDGLASVDPLETGDPAAVGTGPAAGHDEAASSRADRMRWLMSSSTLRRSRRAKYRIGSAAACAAAPHLDEPSVVRAEPGDHPEPVPEEGVDAYALTRATMRGVRVDPAGVVEFATGTQVQSGALDVVFEPGAEPGPFLNSAVVEHEGGDDTSTDGDDPDPDGLANAIRRAQASGKPAVIHVDVDPAMIGRHYPFEVGLVGDAGAVAGQLREALATPGQDLSRARTTAYEDGHPHLQARIETFE